MAQILSIKNKKRNMKKFILSLTFLAIGTITTLAQNTLTKEYSFKDITCIKANSIFDIEVTKGNSGTVKIVYKDIFKDRIKVNCSQGTLELSLDKPSIRLNSNNRTPDIKVYLQMPHINDIELSGTSRLTAEGVFETKKGMEIELDGASSVKGLQAKGEHLSIECSGASQLQMSGAFKKVDTELSGASKIAYTGDCKEFSGEFSGASGASLEGYCDITTIECSGASSVTMEGETDDLTVIVSGASKFKGEKYEAKKGYVEATGASNAQVRCTGELRATVGKASRLTHYGNPEIIDLNKSSNIKKGD